MKPEIFNPAFWDAQIIGKKIEETGARVVLVGNGFGDWIDDLNNCIMTNSLLGLLGLVEKYKSAPENLSPKEQTLLYCERDQYKLMEKYKSALENLSPKEQTLLRYARDQYKLVEKYTSPLENLSPQEQTLLRYERNRYNVVTICDLDGVLAYFRHALFSKKKRKIPLASFRLLLLILIKASNMVVLITGRIDPDSIRERFPFLRVLVDIFARSGIYWFPFFNSSAGERLERWGGGKLKVVTGKPLDVQRRAQQIEEIAEQTNPNVLYIIGSSAQDRRAVLAVCQYDPQLAKRIVYFDTMHVVI